MEDLIAVINAALRERGWSARQASVEAVGNAEFIRTLRRGSAPPVDRFRALCETLGLEFYVGPKRNSPVDEQRLEVAVETAARAVKSAGLDIDSSEFAKAVAAIYELVGEDATSANAARVSRLAAALTSGGAPRRETAKGKEDD